MSIGNNDPALLWRIMPCKYPHHPSYVTFVVNNVRFPHFLYILNLIATFKVSEHISQAAGDLNSESQAL